MRYRLAFATPLLAACFFVACAESEPPTKGAEKVESLVEPEQDFVETEATQDQDAVLAFCGGSFPPCSAGQFCINGVCKAPGGPGAFCGGFADPPCRSDLFCANGICKAPGGPGAFCGGFADPPCRSDLFCRNGICKAPGGPGAFCGGFADPPCGSGLSCVNGICRQ